MSFVSLFALAFGAAIGLTMAVLHFRGVKSGMALGIAHGVFTLGGIALLVIGLGDIAGSTGWWIALGLGVVALGGAYLFYRQTQDEPWPGFVIVAHGGLALVMIAALGVWLFSLDSPQTTDVPASPLDEGQPAVGPGAPEDGQTIN